MIQLVLATDVSKHLEILGHFHNRMANEGVVEISPLLVMALNCSPRFVDFCFCVFFSFAVLDPVCMH